MFFEELDQSRENIPVTMFDHYISRMIYAIAIRVSPGLRWRKSKWAEQIRLLRTDLSQDTDRIEAALLWLTDNWKKKSITCTSAKWFRRNFSWIESAMNRDRPAAVTLSPLALTIKEKTKGLIFSPPPAPNELDSFIENSVQNYIKFRSDFKCLYHNRDLTPRLKGVIEHIWRKLPTHEAFVLQWVQQIHKQVSGWTEWSGSLKSFVFTYTHKNFQQTIKRWIVEYTGSDKAWETIKALIKEHQG